MLTRKEALRPFVEDRVRMSQTVGEVTLVFTAGEGVVNITEMNRFLKWLKQEVKESKIDMDLL